MKANSKLYLQLLADDKNLIVYANESTDMYGEIFDKFKTFNVLKISERNVANVSNALIEYKANLVIIFDCKNINVNKQLMHAIRSFSSDIDILFIAKSIDDEMRDVLSMADGLSFAPLSLEMLWRAAFGVLSTTYTIHTIANTEKSLSKITKPINKDDFEEFLDTWEGKIMFLSQDIDEIVHKLDSGELSNELLQQAATKIDEVESIFRTRSYTKKVAPIFSELSGYLQGLKIENVAIEHVEGFDYLARILEDVNVYIVDYFVDRIFKDVYVFQDSLLSNINYMENKIAGVAEEEDDSELHFF